MCVWGGGRVRDKLRVHFLNTIEIKRDSGKKSQKNQTVIGRQMEKEESWSKHNTYRKNTKISPTDHVKGTREKKSIQ